MTLPSAYNHFVTAWESFDENKRNLYNLTNRLILEQTRMNRDNVESKAFATNKQKYFK